MPMRAIRYGIGDCCTHLLFTVDGKARGYAVDGEGKEFTAGFYFNNKDSRTGQPA